MIENGTTKWVGENLIYYNNGWKNFGKNSVCKLCQDELNNITIIGDNLLIDICNSCTRDQKITQIIK